VAHLEDLLCYLSELQAARSEVSIPSLATCTLKLNTCVLLHNSGLQGKFSSLCSWRSTLTDWKKMGEEVFGVETPIPTFLKPKSN